MIDLVDRNHRQQQILDKLDAIEALYDDFVADLTGYFAENIATAPPAAAATPAAGDALLTEPRVWDITPDALENYTAAQLVELKTDHRADNHDPEKCEVCAVIARRLGGL